MAEPIQADAAAKAAEILTRLTLANERLEYRSDGVDQLIERYSFRESFV